MKDQLVFEKNENVKGIQVSVLGTVYLQGAYIE